MKPTALNVLTEFAFKHTKKLRNYIILFFIIISSIYIVQNFSIHRYRVSFSPYNDFIR